MTDFSEQHRLRPITVAGPILASTAFVMELTMLPLLLALIQSDLNLSVAQLAWVFNIYAAAVAAAVLAGGWLGDALGSRRVFIAGAILFAAGAIGASQAEDYGVLLLARMVQGTGGGLFSPLVPVLLTGATPQRPGRILIVWGSIAGFVAAFGPLLGSVLVTVSGWQIVFWVFAAIAILALLFAPVLPSAMPREESRPRLPGLGPLLRAGRLWCVFLYVFCTYGAVAFFLFDLPLEIDAAGHGTQFMGVVLAVLWLSFATSGTLMRNAVDGRLLWPITLAGPVLIAAGFALALWPFAPLSYIVAAVAVGMGFACTNAPSTQLVLHFAPQGMRAISTSLDITFARLGGVMTVTLLARSDPAYVIGGILLLSSLAIAAALRCVHRD